MMKFGFGKNAGEGAEKATGKLEKVKAQLAAMQGAAPVPDKVGGGETIADDGVIPADRQTQIAADEALVREALALVGVDYDALIKMDGQSVYSNAVKANPGLLKDVLGSERPVIAALRVAMGFKPVADFVSKYGSTPEDIKAAMRAEFEAEMADKETGRKPAGPVFSSSNTGTKPSALPKKAKLADVFGK